MTLRLRGCLSAHPPSFHGSRFAGSSAAAASAGASGGISAGVYPSFADAVAFKRDLRSVASRVHVSAFQDHRGQVLDVLAETRRSVSAAADAASDGSRSIDPVSWLMPTPVTAVNRRLHALSDVVGHVVTDELLFDALAVNLDLRVKGAKLSVAVAILAKLVRERRAPVSRPVALALVNAVAEVATALERLQPSPFGRTSAGTNSSSPDALRARTLLERFVLPVARACAGASDPLFVLRGGPCSRGADADVEGREHLATVALPLLTALARCASVGWRVLPDDLCEELAQLLADGLSMCAGRSQVIGVPLQVLDACALEILHASRGRSFRAVGHAEAIEAANAAALRLARIALPTTGIDVGDDDVVATAERAAQVAQTLRDAGMPESSAMLVFVVNPREATIDMPQTFASARLPVDMLRAAALIHQLETAVIACTGDAEAYHDTLKPVLARSVEFISQQADLNCGALELVWPAVTTALRQWCAVSAEGINRSEDKNIDAARIEIIRMIADLLAGYAAQLLEGIRSRGEDLPEDARRELEAHVLRGAFESLAAWAVQPLSDSTPTLDRWLTTTPLSTTQNDAETGEEQDADTEPANANAETVPVAAELSASQKRRSVIAAAAVAVWPPLSKLCAPDGSEAGEAASTSLSSSTETPSSGPSGSKEDIFGRDVATAATLLLDGGACDVLDRLFIPTSRGAAAADKTGVDDEVRRAAADRLLRLLAAVDVPAAHATLLWSLARSPSDSDTPDLAAADLACIGNVDGKEDNMAALAAGRSTCDPASSYAAACMDPATYECLMTAFRDGGNVDACMALRTLPRSLHDRAADDIVFDLHDLCRPSARLLL